MHSAHSTISSSSYASLPWVPNPVVEGVRILPLLSISLRQDADVHHELTGYHKFFPYGPRDLMLGRHRAQYHPPVLLALGGFCKVCRLYARRDASISSEIINEGAENHDCIQKKNLKIQ